MSLLVRPALLTDLPRWCEVLGEPDTEAAATRWRAYARATRPGPLAALCVEDDGVMVGACTATLFPARVVVEHLADRDRADVLAALVDAIRDTGGDGTHVVLHIPEADDARRAVLDAHGAGEPVVALRRDLRVPLPIVPELLVRRAPNLTFTRNLVGSIVEDADEGARLVDGWAAAYGATAANIAVAYVEGEPVGLVVPGLVPHRRATGTSLFLGVVEPHRRRGIGRALHAWCLRALADKGVRTFVDTVPADNAAVRAIAAGHGCEEVGASLRYTLPCRGERPRWRIDDLHTLATVTDRIGPGLTLRDGWVHLPTRSHGRRVVVHVRHQPDLDIIHIEATFVRQVPESHRPGIARRICALNARLTLPGFALDPDDGRLSYRSFVFVPEGGLDAATLRRYLDGAIHMAGRFARDLSGGEPRPPGPAWAELTEPL